jgi:hypothetical protein
VRRSFGLATVLVALSLAFPLAASAAPPWSRIPVGVVADFPPGSACPAATGEVTVTYLGGSSGFVLKRDGRVMAMGGGHYEVTAGATGMSVVVHTDGMITLSPDGNIQTGSGKIMWGFGPGEVGPGNQSSGRLLAMTGHQISQYSPPAFSYSGQAPVDVCAAIS